MKKIIAIIIMFSSTAYAGFGGAGVDKNKVNLTTDQTVCGNKTFCSNHTIFNGKIGIATTTVPTESLQVEGNAVIVGSVTAAAYFGSGVGLTGLSVSTATYSVTSGSAAYVTNYCKSVVRETPSGDIDGFNDKFYLSKDPESGSESVFVNGLLTNSGGGDDYTIFLGTITFNAGSIPATGWSIKVNYCYPVVGGI